MKPREEKKPSIGVHRKRFALALVVAFVLATLFDIVLNGVVLRSAFEAGARYWRPPDELNRLAPLGWLSMLLMFLFFGLLFVRAGLRGVRQGLEFGSWLALASVAGVAGMATLVPWPREILAGMAVQQAGNALLLGVSLGWLYRDGTGGLR
ncbi:hypothetical protein HRbin10_02224 [bacterium HR10]|nr:hypothetical protein HRbin10_02224 [bacterium HR10]